MEWSELEKFCLTHPTIWDCFNLSIFDYVDLVAGQVSRLLRLIPRNQETFRTRLDDEFLQNFKLIRDKSSKNQIFLDESEWKFHLIFVS
jgi:hypothetical protein